MDAFRQSDVPNEAAAKQIAEAMFLARKSKAEIWQELTNKRVDAAMATAVVQAVAERHEVSCSSCGALVWRSDTTLSSTGALICPACSQQQQTKALYQRATESAGTAAQARKCRRCGRSMVYSGGWAFRLRWVFVVTMSITVYTFECRSCSHRFTGYEGTLPIPIMIVACAGVVLVATHPPWDASDVAKLAGSLALILFFLYKYLIWLRYPSLGWAGGVEDV